MVFILMDNGDAYIGENPKAAFGWDQVITDRKITVTVYRVTFM